MRYTFLLPAILVVAGGPLAAQLIGTEDFAYDDGPIADRTGGSGFNRDLFDGAVTATSSDWDNVFGTPAVSGNSLTTGDSGAKREYNGPIEGAGGGGNDGEDDHERSGAVRGAGRVFYRFTITRGAGTTWSGASSYDFGAERVFFGVPGGNGPTTGGLEFGCSGGGNDYFTGIPADNATRTIVTVLDFDHNFIGLWVDPTGTDFYNPADGSNSADAGGLYTPDNWSTAVRLASGGGGTTTWDDLTVALDPGSVGLESEDPNDADGDGLPASWEAFHGLDDNDDGTNGESSPGAKDGPNGASGDPDGDTLTNLEEFQSGTFPYAPDSDFDFLDDAEEKALGTNPLKADSDDDALTDYEEVHLHSTNPLLADGDAGGTCDFTEIALGTDPGDPEDDPATGGNMELIGMEFFDSYTDGPVAGRSEGLGWDYDNSALPETFTGHTTLRSAWANIGGAPTVQSGWLLTQESSVKRPFHGGPADPAAAVGERSGAFREDSAATGINGSDVLYLKVNIARQTGASWSGISLYDFGAERIFLGVLNPTNPSSGIREFGIEQSVGAVRSFSGIAPTLGAVHTLVGRYDFSASRIDLWVDPDLSEPEGNATIAASLAVTTAQMNATGIRLGSGGTGPTAWDGLVAGTTWESLTSQPSDSDGDGMPDDYEDLHGFDNETNDAGLDADNDGLYNLEEYLAGTNPRGGDSDGDGLDDGAEVKVHGTDPTLADTDGDGLGDGTEVNDLGTDPTLVDTDGDGQTDGGEVFGHLGITSDPLDPGDTVGAPLRLIGTEDFAYGDGAIAGQSGGTHFDYENWLFNGPFVGHTSTTSDWDGTAAVAGGKLVTRDTYAYRDFNGPGEGPGNDQEPTDARMGAVNADGNHAATIVYFKATMTRRAGAELSLFGPDDFDQERLAFGIVDDGGILRWGIREGEAVSTDGGALPIPSDESRTVVGKLDFTGNLLSLWVDPDLRLDEAANAPQVTRAYLGTNWASGVRLSSTGTGDTEWDDVIVATAWEELSGASPLPFGLKIEGYDPEAGVIRFTAPGIPADATFHLRSSTDLKTFVPLDPAFDFDSDTPQPFVIPVNPGTVPRLFFRADEGPTPP